MDCVEPLTKRELECLYYAAQDKDCRETAALLHLSPETIKSHRKLILRKLGCRTMVAALMIAVKKELIGAQFKKSQ